MCPNYDINAAFFKAFHTFFQFLRGAEATEFCDVQWEFTHSLFEIFIMLFGQNSGGHQNADLVSIFYCLKGGSHCHFGFSKTDISAEQSVHGLCPLHVLFDRFDCGQLIRSFSVGKGVFKLALPFSVWRKCDSGPAVPFRL